MQLIRQSLILAAVIFGGRCLFCQYNITFLDIALDNLLDTQEVVETRIESLTLKYCLQACLGAECQYVIFCNDECWFATKDIVAEVNDEVQKNSSGEQSIVFDKNSRKAISFCAQYPYLGLSIVPTKRHCVMYEYFAASSTQAPLNLLVYRIEEEASTGMYQFNTWTSGTTLQFQIPQGTYGAITFMQEGNKKLVLNINPTNLVNVEDGIIAFDSSVSSIVRLRKPLEIRNLDAVQCYVIPENALCMDEKTAPESWSVGVRERESNFRIHVLFDFNEAHNEYYAPSGMNYTDAPRRWFSFDQDTEVKVSLELSNVRNSQRFSSFLNDIYLGISSVSFQFEEIYMSEGLTITDCETTEA